MDEALLIPLSCAESVNCEAIALGSGQRVIIFFGDSIERRYRSRFLERCYIPGSSSPFAPASFSPTNTSNTDHNWFLSGDFIFTSVTHFQPFVLS